MEGFGPNPGIQDRMEQAMAAAAEPQGLAEWAVWLVQQLVTVNVAWVLVSLAIGLLASVGATEFSKRFGKLFAGENWALKVQLFAALWGAVVTSMLIVLTTDWPAHARICAAAAIAPLAAFYAPRTYDVLRRLFPDAMAAASRKLRGEQNIDATPP